jgi:hypothetical protein
MVRAVLPHRAAIRIGLAVVFTATMLASGVAPAGAAAGGWHFAGSLPAGQSTINAAFAAPSARTAWVFGEADFGALHAYSLVGGKWRQKPIPAALTGTSINVYAAAGSAADNVWLLGSQAVSGNETPEYASRWNGHGWMQHKLRSITDVDSAVTLSPSDTWIFGRAPGGRTLGRPEAQRFSGTAWTTVPTPAFVLAASAPSARSIWALGPTLATVNKPANDWRMVFMHWRGSSWGVLPAARFRLPDGRAAEVLQFTALSATDLWAIAGPVINPCGCVTAPAGLLLEHWNGHRWSETKLPGDRAAVGPAADGAGGVWLATRRGQKEYFLHFHDGKLTAVPVPRVRGAQPVPLALDSVPHSRSVWAVGQNVLLRYTP